MPLPLDWKPDRGSTESYVRVREQARIVAEARAAGSGKFELLPIERGFGLGPHQAARDLLLREKGHVVWATKMTERQEFVRTGNSAEEERTRARLAEIAKHQWVLAAYEIWLRERGPAAIK
jgi:hypothetical protein